MQFAKEALLMSVIGVINDVCAVSNGGDAQMCLLEQSLAFLSAVAKLFPDLIEVIFAPNNSQVDSGALPCYCL